MSRLAYGFAALLAIGGVIAAFVQAQDGTGGMQSVLRSPNNSLRSSSPDRPGLLSQQLRSASAKAISDAGSSDSTAVAADEGAYSVLKGAPGKSANAPPQSANVQPAGARFEFTANETESSDDESDSLSSRRLSSRRIHQMSGKNPPTAAATGTPTIASAPGPANAASVPPTTPSPSDQPQAIEPTIATPVANERSLAEIGKLVARTSEQLACSLGPLLRIDTIGPKAITVGEPAVFVITIANRGEAPAQAVMVRVAVPQDLELIATEATSGNPQMQDGPDGVARLVWTVEDLAGRTDRQLKMNVVARSNRALELAVDWALLPAVSIAKIEVQQPQLEIALSGPKDVLYGETKVYSVVVSNPGTGEARNVAVNLALGAGSNDTLRVGTIPAGEQKKFDIEVTARETGTLQIVAQATGAGDLQAEATEDIHVRRANLELESLGPKAKFAGSIGTYRVRVANTGDAVASGVQAAARLPQGAKYLRGLEVTEQSGDALLWLVGDLPPGGERIFEFHCELANSGKNEFRFGVRSNGGLETSSATVTQVESIADLKLSVNDPKGPIAVGEPVVYELTIMNRGTKAATNVNVVTQFSEGIEPIEAQGSRFEVLPGQIIFHPIPRIVPGETVTLTIKAKAESDGNHVFRAEVKCEQPQTRLVAEDSTQFFSSDDLSADSDSPAEAASGEPTPATPSDSIYGR